MSVLVAALGLAALALAASPGVPQGLRDRPLFPKRPAPVTKPRVTNVKGLSCTLSGVPEYEWYYGCSPTAAGMIIGWWDAQAGCTNLFAGSAATWSGNANAHTMVASAAHIAAGQALSLTYGSYKNHVADCLADFIGTHNAGTDRDKIGPGLVSFCAWAGPSAYKNVAYSATATTYYEFNGWSYEDYCAEIDAGRPVHLGLTSSAGGHSVVGIGYDKTGGKQNYICWTTWPGWGVRSWGWSGESESGYNFYVYAGTYLRVTPNASSGPPTAPTTVSVSPSGPVTTADLTASASGSSDPNGDAITYEYQWARSTDGGTTWSGWDWSGAALGNALTTKGEKWQARARASAGGETSAWASSAPVTIANSSPTAPPSVSVTPTGPVTTDDLAVAAGGSGDADGDTLTYEYQWAKSTDGGATWSGWNWSGAALANALTARGELWRAQARVSDGTASSGWTVGLAVTVANSAPTVPASASIVSANPLTLDDLVGSAAGSADADGDAVTYEYQWTQSTDGGQTWCAWKWPGATLSNTVTSRGDQWKVRACASDGALTSGYRISTAVTVGNTPPSAPTSVAISPTSPRTTDGLSAVAAGSADADGDALTYEYQWSKSTDGGASWSGWNWTGASVSSTATAEGEQWRVAARAGDGSATSGWAIGSTVVTISNSAPSAPSLVSIAPAEAVTTDDLTATGAGATDVDGGTLVYEYQWSRSTDGGLTWSAWSWSGATLSNAVTTKGEQWRARARATDGVVAGDWAVSAAVAIANSVPTIPASASIVPASPLTLDDLVGGATGSTDADGDPLTYEYQWTQSTDGGLTWCAWKWAGATLSNTLTSAGDQWKVRACASDGTASSGYRVSAAATVDNTAPSAPTSVAISPASPVATDDLAAVAAGSADADGGALTYEYQWSRSTDGGGTWSGWNWTGASVSSAVTAEGDKWRVQARASDGVASSGWTAGSAVVTIGSSAPSAPSAVAITPTSPVTTDDLTATGSGASDAEGGTLTYEYQWSKSTDGGATWSAWDWSGATLGNALTAKGEQWRARGRASDGTAAGAWTTGAPVTIGNSIPTLPASAAITPTAPVTLDNLVASAAGSTDADGDTLTYRYEWTRSTNSGATWSAWKWSGATLSKTLTKPGEQWKVRACAGDGTATSGYRVSAAVTIRRSKRGLEVSTAGPALAVSAAVSAAQNRSHSITVSLSAEAQVEVAIQNLAGRTVAVLPSRSLEQGLTTLCWNGRSTSGTLVPAGPYLLRLRACDASGNCGTCLVPLTR